MKMRKEFDFSKAQKTHYARRLKHQVTIRMDEGTVRYFKELAQEIGVSYQTLINLYLRDCAASHKKLSYEKVYLKTILSYTLELDKELLSHKTA